MNTMLLTEGEIQYHALKGGSAWETWVVDYDVASLRLHLTICHAVFVNSSRNKCIRTEAVLGAVKIAERQA